MIFGYIGLPTDMDREQFITLCHQSKTVSVRTEIGGFHNHVPISLDDLNVITFPETYKDLGSGVVLGCSSEKEKYFILKVFEPTSELLDTKENQFKIKRHYNGSSVEVTGSGKDKFIGITVDSSDKEEGSGTFYVSVSNKSKSAKLKVEVLGNIELFSEKKTTINSSEKILLKTTKSTDPKQYSSFEQTNNLNHFVSDKFKINNGDQSMVLGDLLKDFSDRLITTLAASTVTTALGQMPLLNATQIANFKQETNKWLSKIGSLD